MNWIPLILFAILFILFFLFGLITAPYRLVQEVESERDQLKKRLDNRAQRQAAMARLWALRAEGVNLRNRPVPEGGFGEWHQAYSNWRDRVLAEARVVSPNFEAWLDTLDRVRLGPALAPPLNDEHGRHRNNMSEMLLRMQEFLQAKMLNKDIENSAG